MKLDARTLNAVQRVANMQLSVMEMYERHVDLQLKISGLATGRVAKVQSMMRWLKVGGAMAHGVRSAGG